MPRDVCRELIPTLGGGGRDFSLAQYHCEEGKTYLQGTWTQRLLTEPFIPGKLDARGRKRKFLGNLRGLEAQPRQTSVSITTPPSALRRPFLLRRSWTPSPPTTRTWGWVNQGGF